MTTRSDQCQHRGMSRTTYHHGNLKHEVLIAATRKVESGGMDAVTAREIAREVGVAPAAIYRHFPDVHHLKAAVSQDARQRLAAAMISARDAVPEGSGRSVDQLAAAGRAYVDFAVREPGLFNAAFADCGAPPDHEDDPSAWGVLTSVLDDLVASGDLSPDLRQDAPLICWTSVHGLASLVSFGELPPVEDVGAATDAVVHGVQRSLGLR